MKTKQTNRKITVKKAGPEYTLDCRDVFDGVTLSELEAASLLHQLLVLLPDIPYEAAHHLKRISQHKPVVVVYFTAINGQVVESHRQSESLFSDGARIVHGPVAIDTQLHTETINDTVSYFNARREALVQQATAYAASQGISLKELMAQAHAEAEAENV